MRKLEGTMTVTQAVLHMTLNIGVFVGGIFAARYVNMLFDNIHSSNREKLPPGVDTPVKAKRG